MAHYESLNQSDHSSEYKWKFKTLVALLAGTCVTKCVDDGEGSDRTFRSIFVMVICCKSRISLVNTIVRLTLFCWVVFSNLVLRFQSSWEYEFESHSSGRIAYRQLRNKIISEYIRHLHECSLKRYSRMVEIFMDLFLWKDVRHLWWIKYSQAS